MPSNVRYDCYDAYSVHKYIGVMYDGTPFPNTNNALYNFKEYANRFFYDNARKLWGLVAHDRQRYGALRDCIMTEWNYYGFSHSDPRSQAAASLRTRMLAQDLRTNLQTKMVSGCAMPLPAYAFCLLNFTR